MRKSPAVPYRPPIFPMKWAKMNPPSPSLDVSAVGGEMYGGISRTYGISFPDSRIQAVTLWPVRSMKAREKVL